MTLKVFEASRRRIVSRRRCFHPLTTSCPSQSFASNAGISSGSS
jgi:hypothetical protein